MWSLIAGQWRVWAGGRVPSASCWSWCVPDPPQVLCPGVRGLRWELPVASGILQTATSSTEHLCLLCVWLLPHH